MPVFKPKIRMISFRLSEEQFQSLREVSLRTGARSVSEYARDAVCHMLNNGHEGSNGSNGSNGDGVAGRINRLAFDLESLDAEIRRLRLLVAEPREARK